MSLQLLQVTLVEKKDGKYYTNFIVQGWKEDGKWKRKQFKEEKDAKAFMALKEIELLNEGESQRTVLSKLTDDQITEAEAAFSKLGDTYSLTQAIEYFLKNHREPDYVITIDSAMGVYLDYCAEAGARERSVKARKSVLEQFSNHAENPNVHEITAERVTDYLKSLRAKDGISPATRKTWNNYRNEINHFMDWCTESDLSTKRPYVFKNCVQEVRYYKAKQVAEQQGEIFTTSLPELLERMTYLLTFKDGVLAKYYALAYFAGIRPDGELQGLSKQEKTLINLQTMDINIPVAISKTGDKRNIGISENLKVWLERFEGMPIIPTNFSRLNKEFRKLHGLTHDETRHTFISYHVALHRSVGEVALQAGNSEGIVKKHYLNLYPIEEGQKYFSVIPDGERAVISDGLQNKGSEKPFLKVI